MYLYYRFMKLLFTFLSSRVNTATENRSIRRYHYSRVPAKQDSWIFIVCIFKFSMEAK